MHFRSQLRFCTIAALLGLVLVSLTAGAQQKPTYRGRKYKAPPKTARIEVTVLRDVNGKPVENAAVIFHPIAGEVDKGNMELKTNEDGKTVIDVLPMGDTVRLQIIARGFQTYGEDFKVEKLEMALEIRLKRPGEQYSIYKDHGQSSDAGQNPHSDKPENPPAGAAKDDGKASGSASDPAPASKDKPAAQSGQSQPPK
jgi:hypothetical protein